MTQDEAVKRIFEFLKEEPKLSAISIDTPVDLLRVRHGGYDIRGAQADCSVVLPLKILLDLEKKGIIGKLATAAYSFVGACSQKRLLKQTGPRWVKMLRELEINAALLVPA